MLQNNLSNNTCAPCNGNTPVINAVEANELLKNLPGWILSADSKSIHKEFKSADFADGLAFTNKVGALAESQNHHPDILLAWGKVAVTLWTHAIGGLSMNDFILASKIETL